MDTGKYAERPLSYDQLDAVPAFAVLGGVSLYLLGLVAFRYRHVHSVNRQRLLLAVVLLILVPVAMEVPAVVALVTDATPALYGTKPFAMTSVLGYWQELAPASLEAAHAAVVKATMPWVWDPVATSILTRPTPVLFGGLAVFFGFLGRRKEPMKVHIN